MLFYPILERKEKIKLDGVDEEMWNLLHLTYAMPGTFKYQIVQVEKDYVARPDLLSKHIYGVTDNADLICKLNGISNPFELNEGMYLILPEASDIMFFYNTKGLKDTLAKDDDIIDSTDIKNLQKKKNEPRKANEQIIGDSNFRIDKNNKVVIY